jgi:hypothetical protein
MPLLGDGYKIIADKFQAEATKIRLIGMTIPVDGDRIFRGIFDTRADLVAAYLATNETGGSIAFVKTGDAPDTGAGFYRVVTLQGGTKTWLRAEDAGFGDTRFNISGEGFYQSPEQNTTFTATTVTSANTSGTPLQLSQPFVFTLSALPANTVAVIMQGIRFEDGSNNDIYDWGFGTDNWAGFIEPGEFIVSSWNFKLGGFPTPTP